MLIDKMKVNMKLFWLSHLSNGFLRKLGLDKIYYWFNK